MKHSNRIFTFFSLFALLVVTLGVTSRPAAAAPVYTCFPTCSTTDGKFLALAGAGFSTLAGDTITVEIAVPSTASSFDIGIFDGDTGGQWDQGPDYTPSVYQIDADPLGDGSSNNTVLSFTGANDATNTNTPLPDNAWYDVTIPTSAAAQSPSGNYFYHIHVINPDSSKKSSNGFKIRTSGTVEMAPQAFAFVGADFSVADRNTIYPSFPALTPTTYDGTWNMYVYVPSSRPDFTVWDGDLDFGSNDCSVNDTNDPDTPDAPFLPPWAVGTAAVPEGVATSYVGPGTGILCPNGTSYTTGNPPDDNAPGGFTRSPSVTYDIVLPDGTTTYHNANPSGNLEWEHFEISSNAADVPNNADYSHAGLLPAGIYKAHLNGVDLHNLNAWRFSNYILGVCADGTPCGPILHPYLVGDTVWNDANGNGVQDAGEAGIPGVTVTLLDANGNSIPGETTATDANGQYQFNVDAGTFTVQIDASNFNAGGALAGDASTTGGNDQTNTVTTANVLTYDFGYRPTASIGDFVWNDLNGNGIQDAGEPGIQAVTVKLLGSDGTTVLATTTTAADGSYSFANLAAGTYFVQFTTPSGYTFTTKNALGSTAANDSNAIVATGVTDAISLAAGATDTTIDAGLYQPASIGDFVWNDLNGNGIQDSGELGLSGITVNLLNAAGSSIITTTTTDVNGGYSFPNLVPGTYQVQFLLPGGDQYSPYLQGSDTTKDSNANPANSGQSGPITLISGQTDTSWDAGLVQPASIGDFVWNDQNGNGIQDAGEPGLSGITVNLLNAAGSSVITTTTTDANGGYSFPNLAPGTYQVQFVLPSGDQFSPYLQGSDTSKDSNANPVNLGLSGPITLSSGQTDTSWDAGLVQLGSISGTVYNDLNGNGTNDSGEPGISGVTVTLKDSGGNVVATTTTDAYGNYSFPNLAPGTYSVTETDLSGYTSTGDTQGANDNVVGNIVVTGGATASGNNFFDWQPGYIGNFVWNDQNGNGIQDSGEPGLQGVTVTLLGSDGTTVVTTTTTNASGYYAFNNLAAGTYYLQFTAPSGYTFTTKNAAGSTAANDSNANVPTGKTDAISLAAGASDNTIDAGLYQPASIGDFVWNDLNGNGIQDSGELGLSGITVNLLNAAGSSVITTTTTDANGNYSFPNLAPGIYQVQFVLPAGDQYSQYLQGSDTTKDSNANPASSGKSGPITLSSGQTDTSWDAGLVLPAGTGTIGDFVWNDINGNGIQNVGETGLQGVTVQLLGSNGTVVVASTTTNASGNYSFTNLAAGTYYVQFTAPSGYGFTLKNVSGSTTANDSNANASTGKSDAIVLAAGATDNSIDAGLLKPFVCANNLVLNPSFELNTGSPPTNWTNGTAGSINVPAVDGKNVGYITNNGIMSQKVTVMSGYSYTLTFFSGSHNPKNQYVKIQYFTSGNSAIGSASVHTITSDLEVSGFGGPYTLSLGAAPSNAAYLKIMVSDNGYDYAKVDALCLQATNSPATSAAIGDFVWNDLNGNGIQDSGELGLSGITVNLLNAAGSSVITTTTTDANGNYSFPNLAPGIYQVQFVLPAGDQYSQYLQGSDTTKDSNANPASSGKSGPITLSSGQTDTSWDAGLVLPAGTGTIGDFVWNDINGNGIQNVGETGLQGVTVQLLGSNGTVVVASTTTNASGNYSFTNLAAGTYYVQFTAPSGYGFTLKNVSGSTTANDSNANASTGKSDAIVLAAGATDNSIDAGLLKPFVCANNLVLNPSFELNTGSPPTNWTNGTAGSINVPAVDGKNVGYITNNGIMSQKVTVMSGYSYTLTFFSGSHNPKNQYVKIQYFTSGNSAIGSASVHTITSDLEVSGFGGPYTLSLGAAPSNAAYLKIMVSDNGYDYAKVDALCLQATNSPATSAAIGDFVWNDLNGNGIQDSGEPGLQGVSVQLFGSDGTTGVASTTTDANGSYSFTNLAGGTYYVQFTAPSGYTFTAKNAGGSPAADSNANTSTGKTDAITLAAGATDNTIDAGLYQPTQAVNLCAPIRTPGFWKNYSNHMTDATFLSLLQNTQDFKSLNVNDAVTILSTNNGNSTVTGYVGVDAKYLKFLLTAELNAVWNGNDSAAALGGILGTGTYQGTGMTVNALLHQAYLDRTTFSSTESTQVTYLGSGGEGVSASACLVQP